MTKHREDLTRGVTLPSTWVNAAMEFVGSLAANFRVERASTTVVRVPAGTGNDQVALAIQGRWRFNTSEATATHPGGAAGTYDLWATSPENDLSGTDPTDNTSYSFATTIRARSGGNPSPPPASGATAKSRRVAEVVWDGASITRVVNLVNRGRGGDPLYASAPTPSEPPLVVKGASGQATYLDVRDSNETSLMQFGERGLGAHGLRVAASSDATLDVQVGADRITVGAAANQVRLDATTDMVITADGPVTIQSTIEVRASQVGFFGVTPVGRPALANSSGLPVAYELPSGYTTNQLAQFVLGVAQRLDDLGLINLT